MSKLFRASSVKQVKGKKPSRTESHWVSPNPLPEGKGRPQHLAPDAEAEETEE